MRRSCATAALGLVALAATAARADDLSASVGAGVVAGEGSSAVAIGAAIDRPWITLSLAARVRSAGDSIVGSDWTGARGVLGVLRTLALRNDVARARAALEPVRGIGIELAAGALSRIDLGTGSIVAGVVPAIDALPHTGAALRVAGARWSAEAAIDDVLAPRLIAASGHAPVAGWIATSTVAIDPGRDRAFAVASLGMARPITRATWIAAAYADATASGVGAVGAHAGVRGAMRLRGAIVRARAEATAGSRAWTPAPFGPLYNVVADDLTMRADAGDLGGAGAAAQIAVESRGLEAQVGARMRPGLGDELDARLAAAIGPVELAGWMAAESDPVPRDAIATEARVQLSPRFHAGIEVGKLYRRDLGLDGARGMWHALAWFGTDLSR